MKYTDHYMSPLGEILLAADETGLTGLWFVGQKHFAEGLEEKSDEMEMPVFEQTKHWLNAYFRGEKPGPLPPLHHIGTDFQKSVWEELMAIPYGHTATYGEIAKSLAGKTGKASARAVGGAVGRNKISILIPCHRVIGSDGSLTGYAGGIDLKIKLLELERGVKHHVMSVRPRK